MYIWLRTHCACDYASNLRDYVPRVYAIALPMNIWLRTQCPCDCSANEHVITYLKRMQLRIQCAYDDASSVHVIANPVCIWLRIHVYVITHPVNHGEWLRKCKIKIDCCLAWLMQLSSCPIKRIFIFGLKCSSHYILISITNVSLFDIASRWIALIKALTYQLSDR